MKMGVKIEMFRVSSTNLKITSVDIYYVLLCTGLKSCKQGDISF